LLNLINNDPELKDTAGNSTASRLHFESAVIDLVLKNGNQPQADPEEDALPMHLTIYECWFRNDTDAPNPQDDFLESFNDTAVVASGNTPLSYTLRGVTLFDLPVFISKTGCKILKKTNYLIPPGEFITYQIRDPRNKSIVTTKVTDEQNQYIQRGFTKGLFVFFQNAPGGLTNQTLEWECTRHYTYKINSTQYFANAYL